MTRGKIFIKKNPNIDKVLVVGANGVFGRQLVPELLQLGYQVRALQYRTLVERREGLEVVEGHTLDLESMQKAVDGVQAACHLVKATPPVKNPFKQWFDCCLAGAVNLLESAKKANMVRYIAGSADFVFGSTTIPHDGRINENSPKHFAGDHYGLFKIVEEEMCRLLTQYHDWPIEQMQTDWHSWTISNEKARSMLGYRPQINIIDWLNDKFSGAIPSCPSR
jgi:nucleoside-diphosphate-sugar epimerase